VSLLPGSPASLAETDLPDELAISVITIGELRSGYWPRRRRDPRQAAGNLERSAGPRSPARRPGSREAWARLRVLLRDMQKQIAVNDSWIAATAMSLGVPVVTQDEDYVEVPGLKIVRV